MSLGARNAGIYSPEPPPPPQMVATRWTAGADFSHIFRGKFRGNFFHKKCRWKLEFFGEKALKNWFSLKVRGKLRGKSLSAEKNERKIDPDLSGFRQSASEGPGSRNNGVEAYLKAIPKLARLSSLFTNRPQSPVLEKNWVEACSSKFERSLA
jgi:hypothetical protein